MELFVILSATELFREQPRPERCSELLSGLPFEALKLYASQFCHNVSAGEEASAGLAQLHDFQTWFIQNHTTPRFRDLLLGLVAHRAAYRRGGWMLADNHRVANLVMAYAKANPSLVPGDSSPAAIDALLRAQFILNDLVSVATEDVLDQLPIVEMVRTYSMARSWNAWTTMPRAFDIMGTRLPKRLPGLEKELEACFGTDASAISTVLFGAYLFEIHAVLKEPTSPGGTTPPWTRGVLTLADLRPTHTGEAIIREVLELHSTGWDELHQEGLRRSPSDPSILWFLRRPLIRIGSDLVWCFDPALILSAASSGLLWLAREAHERAGNDAGDVFRQLGFAFEDYVVEFIRNAGRADLCRGDDVAEGLSDIYFVEDTTLLVLEAKANTFRDDVKWASDAPALRKEIDKVTKGNQLMKAIARLLASTPDLAAKVQRVIPVLVVLDPAFACPGMETEVRSDLQKPPIPCPVEDPHLLYIGELEVAGNYIREGAFAKLLDARRMVSPNGSLGLGELLESYRSTIQVCVGRWLQPYDAHVNTRAALNDAMREFHVAHDHGAPC
jgi:hypothetical protein